MALFQSIRGRRLGLAQLANGMWNFASLSKEILTPQSVDFSITTAQLLALNTTPISLVAAPGSGRVLIPASLYAYMDYNTTAYDGIAAGEDVVVRYTDGSGNIGLSLEATGFLDQTSDQYRWNNVGTAAATAGGFAPTANAALVLHMATGNIATGNSPLYGRLYYYNVPATLPTPITF